MNKIKIVGICLIQNEDLYIERVLRNTLDFCDEIIVLDNYSNDKTFSILQKMAAFNPKIKLQQIKKATQSHTFVEKYADSPTWVFRIDGDEIYDSKGLKKLRLELLQGAYSEFWRVDGIAINCVDLNVEKGIVSGYMSPPSKNVARLYNFMAIESWIEPNNQRLHGNNIVYKSGYNYFTCKNLFEDSGWEDTIFRCIHICFIKRSSLAKDNNFSRPNVKEKRNLFRKILNLVRNIISGKLSFESNYKNVAYKKGKLITKSLTEFF